MANGKIIKTVVVFFAGIITGINLGALTTTLPDMELWTSSTTSEMSMIFVWIGLANVVGALVIGPLFDHVNNMLLLSICFLLMGIAIGIAPTWPSLSHFHGFATVAAAFYYASVSGCLSVNRNMWKSSAKWLRPIIQMTSLTGVVGTAVGPQIARPFIGPAVHRSIRSNSTVNVTTLPLTEYGGPQPVQVVYLVVGLLDVIMAVVCMIVCVWSSVTNGWSSGGLPVCLGDTGYDDDNDVQIISEGGSTSLSENQPSDADGKRDPCSRKGCVLLAIMFLFFVMDGGRDVMFTGLLYTYLFEYLEWTVDNGTLFVTLYHATRFVAGAVVVPVSRWVTPARLMTFNLGTLMVASALMVGALLVGDAFTALGIIITGLGESNIQPTTITLIEESMGVVAPVMALLVSASGVSIIAVGPVTGTLLELTVASFPVTLAALSLSSLRFYIIYSVILRVARKNERSTTT